jgi:hypothetical protein
MFRAEPPSKDHRNTRRLNVKTPSLVKDGEFEKVNLLQTFSPTTTMIFLLEL